MTAPSPAALAERLIVDGARPETAVDLASMILARMAYGPEGVPTVLDAAGRPALDSDGKPVPVAGLISEFRATLPDLFTSTPKASTTKAPAVETMTAKALRQARERANAPRPTPPNPWKAGTINVTKQVAIAANDPALAARLQREAGRK